MLVDVPAGAGGAVVQVPLQRGYVRAGTGGVGNVELHQIASTGRDSARIDLRDQVVASTVTTASVATVVATVAAIVGTTIATIEREIEIVQILPALVHRDADHLLSRIERDARR